MKNLDPSQLNIPLNFLTAIDPQTGATHSFDTSGAIFEPDNGKFGGISGLQLKDLMLFNLARLQNHASMKEAIRAEAAEAYPILSKMLSKLWAEYKPDGKTIERFRMDISDPSTIRFGPSNIDEIEGIDRYKELSPIIEKMIDEVIPHDEVLFEEYRQLSDRLTPEPEDKAAHEIKVWKVVNQYMQTSAVSFALMVSIYPKKELLKLYKKPKLSTNRNSRKKPSAPFTIKGGHLVDQILSDFYPEPNKSNAPSLFDKLSSTTQQTIASFSVEHTTLVEGIKLTAMEQKIVDALCKLLHNKSSQTSDPKAEGYFTGNHPGKLKLYGEGAKRLLAPGLSFSLYELTCEVTGNTAISGGYEKNVYVALKELASKRFLMSYIAQTKDAKGKTIDKIERYEPLITIVNLSRERRDQNDVQTSFQGMTVIELDPIFTHQIDSKFVKTPSDLTRRLVIASGNTTNIPSATLLLTEYLNRQHGTLVTQKSRSFVHEILVDNLQHKLCGEWLTGPRKRKQRAKEYTDRAIMVARRLGLIESCEVITGATGAPKYVFVLNKEWK